MMKKPINISLYNKKLHQRRKERRKNNKLKEQKKVKIIVDTNIIYHLGNDNALFESVKNLDIIPNYINLWELSNSDNLVLGEDFTRNSIRKLFFFQDKMIFDPPFVHILKLKYKGYKFDIVKELGGMLDFTSLYAKGYAIDDTVKEGFLDFLKKKKQNLDYLTDIFKKEAEEISKRLKNKKAHRKKYSIPYVANFINALIKDYSNNKYNIENISLKNLELFICTMDAFFKDLETGARTIERNDWNDLFVLAYVKPGDKFWTKERKWKDLIKAAGCGHYLYEE